MSVKFKAVFVSAALLMAYVNVQAADAPAAAPAAPAAAAPAAAPAAPAADKPADKAPAAAPAVAAPAAPAAAPAAPAADKPADKPAATPAAPAVAAGPNLSGEWSSEEVDKLSLTQTGSKVTGPYEYTDEDGVKHVGSLELELKGPILKGTWAEQVSGGKYGGAGSKISGTAEFIVSDDGKSLSGKWREADGSDEGVWNAKKK